MNHLEYRAYGITVYRVIEVKEEEPMNRMIELDSKEQSQGSFISMQAINSIDTGIIEEVWGSRVNSDKEKDYHYDGIKAGFKLFTLRKGDIIEFIGTHRLKYYFIVKYEGLKEAYIDPSIIRKT